MSLSDADARQRAVKVVQQRVLILVVERPGKSQVHRSSGLICRAGFKGPFHPDTYSGFAEQFYFSGREVENSFDQFHPTVQLARGVFINWPAGLAPVFGFQPRLPMLARKRPLVALNALWSVIRIPLIAK